MTDHLKRFQRLMHAQYEVYKAACAERGFEDLGYVLLLDRGFAHPRSRLAFLGINPGQDRHVESDEPLVEHGIWNTREPGARHRGYWGIARIILERLLQRRGELLDTVNEAFFGNVIPFRSRSWGATDGAHKNLMRECAQPVTRYLFDEHLYDTVIAVGNYPPSPLAHQPEPMIPDRTEVCIHFPGDGETWPRGCEDQTVRRACGKYVRILKIPHLSRMGYVAAEEIGDWLARRFPESEKRLA